MSIAPAPDSKAESRRTNLGGCMNGEIPEAIPGCLAWRIANPEPCDCGPVPRVPHTTAAPYCCSAYCARCAYFRTHDGVPMIEPNEWMEQA